MPTRPLPPYVTICDVIRPSGLPVGNSRLAVTVLATTGANLVSCTLVSCTLVSSTLVSSTLVSSTLDGVPTYDASQPQAALPAGAATSSRS